MTQNINSNLNIHQKLAKVLIQFKGVEKSETNKHFGSKYRNIEAINKALMPVCLENGLIYYFFMDELNVLTLRVLCIESGEYLDSKKLLPPVTKDQDYGKQMTYNMRYLVSGMFSISQPDDDGEHNQLRTQLKQPEPSKVVFTPDEMDF